MDKLINALKQLSVSANEASDPVKIIFGTVEKEKPLIIRSQQKMSINEKHLLLTGAVMDTQQEMDFDIYTENTNSYTNHNHKILGKKKITICNHLKKGEKVIMLRVQGGQRFIVLDRVVENV
ncbi:MAG: DUF2577 domain-containing protein [Clostridia bacterium]|nr:DUF2577 domain-containing protein [Clostridia bacterium]MCI2000056.1 DUF2577 domain-containing protein [Clostridia bacterium]MCI2014410.1 DUF2577 domain-containing protein [Clostridia bacterium]